MNLSGDEMRKYEYVLDIFKGTCELNNFDPIYARAYNDGMANKDILKSVLNDIEKDEKVYFYGPVLDGKECVIAGGICNKDNPYIFSEVINMCTKFLTNLGMEEISVDIEGEEDGDAISNLEALDISVDLKEKDSSRDDETSFTVYAADEPVVYGGLREDGTIYFYSDIENLMGYVDNIHETQVDVYISPTSKEVLDDAFIIGSNLRDAGFKVEIDYSLKQVTKDVIDASFLVTFDREDIKKYQVKLVDMATKEVKTVKIDNLVEELSFI